MRKTLVMTVLISFLLASCGTLEVEFDTTATSVGVLPSPQATSDQTQPTETITSSASQPTTNACSNKWFFTFDDKHLSLADFCP